MLNQLYLFFNGLKNKYSIGKCSYLIFIIQLIPKFRDKIGRNLCCLSSRIFISGIIQLINITKFLKLEK
jgi:hypothetical protein